MKLGDTIKNLELELELEGPQESLKVSRKREISISHKGSKVNRVSEKDKDKLKEKENERSDGNGGNSFKSESINSLKQIIVKLEADIGEKTDSEEVLKDSNDFEGLLKHLEETILKK